MLLHIALQEGFHHDEVRVSVDARRGVAQTKSVSVDRPTYLGVSLTTEGNLAWKTSYEPFGYL